MKKFKIGMAAFAVVLFGVTSCAGKDSAKEDSGAQAQEIEAVTEQSAPAEANPAEANATDDYDFTTDSGLKYKVVREGTGKQPSATDVVEVNYEGRLKDGTVFDSSYQRGQTIEFPLNRVIPGWTEGLQLMKEGAEYIFYIPSNLAYGDQDLGIIPPNSDLIFRVELIKVK